MKVLSEVASLVLANYKSHNALNKSETPLGSDLSYVTACNLCVPLTFFPSLSSPEKCIYEHYFFS